MVRCFIRPVLLQPFLCRPRSSHLAFLVSQRPISYTSNEPKPFLSIASLLGLPSPEHDQFPHPVEVTGHIRTVRNQKRLSFVELGDGSTTQSLQALLEPSLAKGLGTGTAVTISGMWTKAPQGKQQSYELHAQTVRVLGSADPEVYPIQKKNHSVDYLRRIPHLRLRIPSNALLARLRSDCEFYISDFLRSQFFMRVHPPLITSSDCEGAGEVFTIQPTDKDIHSEGEFFRAPKYLTVSAQLHLEAYVHEHPRVYALSPTFRAEKSDTPRHLSEFYMLEIEMRTQKMDDVMDAAESLIRSVTLNLRDSQVGIELLIDGQRTEEGTEGMESSRVDVIRKRWEGIERLNWPRISYTDAIRLLQDTVAAKRVIFQYEPDWHSGLQLEHEKFIAAEVGQGSPVFVTDYPAVVKPFYMLPTNLRATARDETPTVACFDLLLPETCEVVGGSLREHRLQPLLKSMLQHGLLPGQSESAHATGYDEINFAGSSLDWYLDLRRYGSVPHGGFGLGFDRLLCYLAGVDSIRDVVPWPRYYGRCDG